MDVSAIEPGRDFRKAIDHSVKTCSVLLAIIGQDWLDSKDVQGRRRLDDENDFVRLELASALRRDIPVVPVLVRGTRMPDAERLPAELRDLVYRNAVELTHARWKSDVQLLVGSLRVLLNTPASVEDPVLVLPDAAGVTPAESVRRAAAKGREATVPPDVVEKVAQDLAAYVGPIAELIVRRAAKRSPTVEELVASVAEEIEDEAERGRFSKPYRQGV
jgi:hypothetical protein